MSPPRHAAQSIIHSDHTYPNRNLWRTGIKAAEKAWNTIELNWGNKDAPDYGFVKVYPGEHYRLLHALITTTFAQKVVEIGTFTGLSACTMLAAGAEVHTFDVIAWDQFTTHLTQEMFDSGRLVQSLDDLSQPDNFAKHRQTLEEADIIFLDGPKDGKFEPAFVELLKTLTFRPDQFLLIDDIRLPQMIELWHSLPWYKMDLTSLGHWSGTGLVDLKALTYNPTDA